MNITNQEANLLAAAMEYTFSKSEKGQQFINKLKSCPESGLLLENDDISLAWKKMEYSKKHCLKGKYFDIKEKIKNNLGI